MNAHVGSPGMSHFLINYSFCSPSRNSIPLEPHHVRQVCALSVNDSRFNRYVHDIGAYERRVCLSISARKKRSESSAHKEGFKKKVRPFPHDQHAVFDTALI